MNGTVKAYNEQFGLADDNANVLSPVGSLPMDIVQNIIQSKAKNLLKTRSMHGCPINIPFTDIDDVLARVRAMCVHEVRASDVQFVLAVRAFPLVNNLISLWIYVGSLEQNVIDAA